ncbi:MAG: hypothetical protein E7259_00585 [Lachnospiraceae bacterium]|nr:hypothetical protein [Lachnospiraceae bacterium]
MGKQFKKKVCMVAMGMLLLGLTGCGEEKTTTTESSSTDATSTDALVLEEVSEEEGIVENVVYESTGSKGGVNINAEVVIPEKNDECLLYSLEKDNFDDDDVKTMVESIFDEESYFLYMPYTSAQINFLRDKLTALVPYAQNEDEEQEFSTALYELDFHEENLKSGAPDIEGEIKFYDMSEYTDYEDLNEYQCNVFGTIDGNYAMVNFSKNDYNCQMKLVLFGFKTKTMQNTGSDSYDVKATGNACGYTISEAEDIAAEYISSLGYENMRAVKSFDVLLSSVVAESTYVDENGEEMPNYVQVENPNGYNVYFARGYEGYTVTYDSLQFKSMYGAIYFDENGENGQNPSAVTGSEFIRVYVSDYGVTEVEICNPMMEKELITDEVVLLEFNAINQIAIDYFEALSQEYMDVWYVDKIELGYSIIEDAGEFAIIPTWSYIAKVDPTSRYAYENCYLQLNAMDGSVVYSILE